MSYQQQLSICPCSEPDQSCSSPISHILKIQLNINPSSTLGSSKWSLSLRFSYQALYSPILSPIHATCSTHLILLDMFTLIILCEEYGTLSFSLCSFLHFPVNSSLFSPNTFPCTLFSVTLSLASSLNLTKFHTHIKLQAHLECCVF